MASRLPQPGSDDGTWGDILNDFLSQAHQADGTLKTNSVGATQLQAGAVTKSSIGLGNVDNTADLEKPISTATSTFLAVSHAADGTLKADTVGSTQIQTGAVTKTMVGLGNVDNTSDANKPISTATSTFLAIAHETDGTLKANSVGSAQIQSGAVTKTAVGLGNVDNTSDANKPVSTAVQTALNAKMTKGEQSFNVKDYGAVGDGIANDTTGIQNAINAASIAGGGIVFIPAGTYMVTGISLNGIKKVIIQGAGSRTSTIKQMNGTNLTTGLINATTPGSDLVMRDFGVHGNRTNNTGGADGIRFASSSSNNVFIENVYVREADARGINVTGSDFVINRCYCESNSQAGIGLNTNADRARISFNVCTLNTGDGIYVGSRDVVIMGNKCYSNHDTGINFGGPQEPTGWNQVIGNEVWLNENSGLNTGGADNLIIQGNIAHSNGRNTTTPRSMAGIRIRDTTSYDPVSGINFAANHIIVSGNRCYDDTTVNPLPAGAPGQLYGIEIVNLTAPTTTDDPNNIVIIGNDLEGNLTSAIQQFNVGTDLKIVGNLGVADTAAAGTSPLLGTVSYNPASLTPLSTTSATFVDVDATKLFVTFTAPASGKVLVKMTAARSLAGTSPVQSWNVRSAGADLAGTAGVIATAVSRSRNSHSAIVTGLTAGTSYTFTWGHSVTGTTATSTINLGGTDGPAVMEVWTA